MLLTDRAKAIIQRDIGASLYKDRAKCLEPLFMAPSPDPGDYSQVRVEWMFPLKPHTHIVKYCLFCNDSAESLVLCVSCRDGLCVGGVDNLTGCLTWSPNVEDGELVFRCPFCTKGPLEVSAD